MAEEGVACGRVPSFLLIVLASNLHVISFQEASLVVVGHQNVKDAYNVDLLKVKCLSRCSCSYIYLPYSDITLHKRRVQKKQPMLLIMLSAFIFKDSIIKLEHVCCEI